MNIPMLSSSNILLLCLLSFIGAVFISSFVAVPRLIVYEFLILGILYSIIALLAACRRQAGARAFAKSLLVFSACLFIVFLGLLRTQCFDVQRQNIVQARPMLVSQDGPMTLLKQKFQNVIDQNLSPPQSGILSAVLLGNKYEISKDYKEKLNIAGVRHITAISGMHIVILSGILLWLGVHLGLYRGQAFYFAISILWLFILMIGFQPSAIRAGIMGSMFLFCEKIGRQKTADRALLLTAAVMLAINPSLLRHSIGFQLSFLATLGIIYLMPLFQEFFQAFFQKIINVLTSNVKTYLKTLNLWELNSHSLDKILKMLNSEFLILNSILSMTLAAQVFVLPLLIYYFGQFSIVSPIINILIAPLLPLLMGFGFLFVIFGAMFQPLALIFLFPVWLLLTYITKIVDLFASFSFSSITFHIHWSWLIIIYLLLTIIIWRIKTRQKLKLLP